jgi:hypothetical protein
MENPPQGYIFNKFLSVYPLAGWNSKKVQEFETFNQACDNFWSESELQKVQKDAELISQKQSKNEKTTSK